MTKRPEQHEPDNAPEVEPSTPDLTSLDHARIEFNHEIGTLHDKEMILRPSPKNWPMYPFLCLTHRSQRESSGMPMLGLMHADHGNAVFPVSLYDIPMHGGTLTEAEFVATKIAFGNVEDLLKEWQVD